MKRRFQPNLTTSGRIVRGCIAVALLTAGIFAFELHWLFRAVLFASAAFVAFEALRGWCALRACGIRTRI